MSCGLKNEANPKWKGNEVSYNGLHKWLKRHKGIPFECEECGTRKKRRYEWANISGEYNRDLNNYRSLCVPCHRKEAYIKGEATPWNKGTKGLVKSNSGSFKRGEPSPNKGRILKPESTNYNTLYMRKYRLKPIKQT